MQSNHFGWAQFLAPKAIGDESRWRSPSSSEEGLCSGPSVAQHFARLVFLVDVREALQRLMVPTVLVQCLRDSIAPASVGRWLAGHPLPQSRLIELAVSGHCPHISHPDLVVNILQEVLDARART